MNRNITVLCSIAAVGIVAVVLIVVNQKAIADSVDEIRFSKEKAETLKKLRRTSAAKENFMKVLVRTEASSV